MRFAVGCIGLSLVAAPGIGVAAEQSLSVAGIVGATSDYVYRGVSLQDEKPTLFAYLSAKYGAAYFDAYLVGAELGDDAKGRDLGNLEADFTIGLRPSLANIEFNFGARYTAYPNGRDFVAGTLKPAERDFVEPFAGASVALTNTFSLGGTVYWTPNYYNETGDVLTFEAQAGHLLPSCGLLSSKITTYIGTVTSEKPFVVSPGNGYVYFNVGVEAQVERMLFDLRYWTTDVDGYGLFDQRVVFGAGMSF